MNFFVLHEELLLWQEVSTVSTNSFDYEVPVPALSLDETEHILDELVVLLQDDPSSLLQPRPFDTCKSYIKHMRCLTPASADKFSDILISAFGQAIASITLDLAENASHNFEADRILAEKFAFLLVSWIQTATAISKEETTQTSTTVKSLKSKSKLSSLAQDNQQWDWIGQRERIITHLEHLVELELDRLILATSERDVLTSMICKSISLILESPEVLKREPVCIALIDTLCIIATRYETPAQFGGVRSRIEDFLREDNLADFVANLLNSMIANHNNAAFVEIILKDIADRHFTEKDLKAAKTISKLLVKFSEMRPKEFLKSMAFMQCQFDSEIYAIRCAMIEVVGNLIHLHLVNDTSESAAKSLHSYYDILEERLRDVNYYVRAKVLQVIMKLSERRQDAPAVTDIPLDTRHQLVALTINRLQDKASIVRKNAIKLLAHFIETSPFIAIEEDQGRLSLKYFETHKADLLRVMESKYPTEVLEMLIHGTNTTIEEATKGNANDDVSMDASASESDTDAMTIVNEADADTTAQDSSNSNAVNAIDPIQLNDIELQRLRVLLKYYDDGIQFINQINGAVSLLCDLLSSSIKTEVIEAMRFFVVAFRFEMESSWEGVRRMVHKIWDKDTTDNESSGIREHVIRCYESLFLDPPEGPRAVEDVIADNLVALTQRMNLAELTSLEQLISTMVQTDRFNMKAVNLLWSIFCSKHANVPIAKRQGAVMILGMIGKSRKDILLQNIDRLVRNGLGEGDKISLVLSRHTCLTLQHAAANKRQKGSIATRFDRLNVDHAMFQRLSTIILTPTMSLDWFGFCEQAINTIYALAEQPDMIVGSLVKQLACRVFGSMNTATSVPSISTDIMSELSNAISSKLVIGETQSNPPTTATTNSIHLAQLCFLVGHVAIKQIVHLEIIENEWKRRCHSVKNNQTPSKHGATSDLEQTTGTVEDEFTDRVIYVREHELLFGPKSLLGVFGPLLTHICLNNRTFQNPTLQIMSTLALCKFMCVSSQFCESHLPLLFTILERSDNPTIRSNTLISLGDMTISFNFLIDQSIAHLYQRLTDSDLSVRKNTLMVLTFLILNGMIKVKGQIFEMAKCLEDKDKRISDLAKLFFTELSTKDNAIYNNLPDMISNLECVEEDKYRRIMKFLFEFIKQDRQSESIIDKLCARFCNANTERQWQDIAFCLSLISFSTEKSLKKLVDALPMYQDKLHPEKVYKYFTDIIKKVKKIPGKPELKQMVDEYEKTLQELHVKCVENHEAVIKAEQDKKITSHLPKAMVINKQFNRRDELEHSSDEEDKSAEPEVQKELEENDKIENSDSETETVVFDAFPKRTRSVVSKLPKHIGGSPVTRRQINAMGDD
ncbi:condensin complex non-SMC subunit Cnd1 [Batrachochytrium dendrobatidis]|nr:condensin complex non-SMC subunit Cnd1 [Batrachochytrium dendrobatidis]KAK5671613.1 condensin complex non-SMC subunit Cnd1 [Batrachochytrium dendrobatidis]